MARFFVVMSLEAASQAQGGKEKVLFTIFLIFLGNEIKLDQCHGEFLPNFGCWPSAHTGVTSEGIFLASTHKIFHFDHSGNRVRELAFDPNIWGFTVYHGVLIVNLSSHQTLSIDLETGEQLAEANAFFVYLFQTEGALFGIRYEDAYRSGSPRIVSVIDPLSLRVKRTIFKKPPALKANLHPYFWAAQKKDWTLFANCREGRLYFYNDALMKIEEEQSSNTPASALFKNIELPNFDRPQANMYTFSSPKTLREKAELFFENRMSHPLILGFYSLGEHFLFAFEIPDKVNDVYMSNHLGIQILDAALENPLGSSERYGQIVGVYRDKIYVLYPDRIEPQPSPRNLLRRYEIPDSGIKSKEMLLALFDRYQKKEVRTLRPVIEIIDPTQVINTHP